MNESLPKPKRMPKLLARLLRFIVTKKEYFGLRPVQGTQSSGSLHQQGAELHTSTKTITLEVFRECACHNRLDLLIIKGKPSREQLEAAWQEIVWEFSSIIKNDDSKYIFSLSKRITAMQADLVFIEGGISALRHTYDKWIVEELRSLGIRCNFEEQDPAKYQLELDRAHSLAKRKVHDLQELVDEQERFFKNNNGGKGKTEEDYGKETAMLSRYFRFYIDDKVFTAFKYAMLLNTYMDEARRAAKENVTQ